MRNSRTTQVKIIISRSICVLDVWGWCYQGKARHAVMNDANMFRIGGAACVLYSTYSLTQPIRQPPRFINSHVKLLMTSDVGQLCWKSFWDGSGGQRPGKWSAYSWKMWRQYVNGRLCEYIFINHWIGRLTVVWVLLHPGHQVLLQHV